jgi:hypothetical protein
VLFKYFDYFNNIKQINLSKLKLSYGLKLQLNVYIGHKILTIMQSTWLKL